MLECVGPGYAQALRCATRERGHRTPARRVGVATKESLLELVDAAWDPGRSVAGACGELDLSERRAYRWMRRAYRWMGRRKIWELPERVVRHSLMHGLLDSDIATIVKPYPPGRRSSARITSSPTGPLPRARVGVAIVAAACTDWQGAASRTTAAGLLRRHAIPRAGRAPPEPDFYLRRDTRHEVKSDLTSSSAVSAASRSSTPLSPVKTSSQAEIVHTDALDAEGLLELVTARANGIVKPTSTTRPSRSCSLPRPMHHR